MSIAKRIEEIRSTLPLGVELVAVSKFQPIESLQQAYDVGQRIFGESRPQELASKWEAMPRDIQWHMIGHLQTNKVRLIAPFISMIESVDSLRLAQAINLEAARIGRVIDILLEVHVAQEETKFGWNISELEDILQSGAFDTMTNIRVRGVMGMATYTDDMRVVNSEFKQLSTIFCNIKQQYIPHIDVLSMGMSADYPEAIHHGSTSVRIGSTIFGDR